MNHKAKDKDLTVTKKLKIENQKLKRQLERLRKQLARVDLEVFTNIREAVEAQQREDLAFDKAQTDLEKQNTLRKRWECHKCGDDFLRLVILQRPDGCFYFRKCPACQNKTRLQPLTETIQKQQQEQQELMAI